MRNVFTMEGICLRLFLFFLSSKLLEELEHLSVGSLFQFLLFSPYSVPAWLYKNVSEFMLVEKFQILTAHLIYVFFSFTIIEIYFTFYVTVNNDGLSLYR